MALPLEWQRRIENWQQALWNACVTTRWAR